MKKEIIITFSLYGIGGAQRRAFALANYFADKGEREDGIRTCHGMHRFDGLSSQETQKRRQAY